MYTWLQGSTLGRRHCGTGERLLMWKSMMWSSKHLTSMGWWKCQTSPLLPPVFFMSRFALQIDDRLEAATNLPGSEVCLNHSKHPMDDYQKHCSKKHWTISHISFWIFAPYSINHSKPAQPSLFVCFTIVQLCFYFPHRVSADRFLPQVSISAVVMDKSSCWSKPKKESDIPDSNCIA